MRSMICRKGSWAPLLGMAILVCGALMTSARADVFRVDLQGTFTSELGGVISVPSPFATSFYINTTAAACAPSCVFQDSNPGGAPFVGYANAAISGLSTISLGGQTFSQANLFALFGGVPVVFNMPLTNGAAPLILMEFANSAGYVLDLGGVSCSPCSFANPNPLGWGQGTPGVVQPFPPFASGTVSVRVTGFAGTPGARQCHVTSVSALAHKYGGMAQAAIALKYSSVAALQADITLFCGS
jgi:hypothetical protein